MAIIYGTDFDDRDDDALPYLGLTGTNGDDYYYALDGNDWVYLSQGIDFLDGGNGFDSLLAFQLSQPYWGIKLNATATVVDGISPGTVEFSGGLSTFVSFENFHLTPGNDVAYLGTSFGYNASIFDGPGNDYIDASQAVGGLGYIFNVGPGSDTFVGTPSGDDTLNFSITNQGMATQDVLSGTGVRVQFRAGDSGFAIDAWGYRNEFSGIENVVGTMFNDRIIGDTGANIFEGLDGDDLLDGGDGDDHLIGGSGSNVYIGGQGSDTFVISPTSTGETIRDFEDGIDHVDLYAFGLASGDFLGEIEPHLSSARGGKATILDLEALGGQGDLLIIGLAFGDASADDFLF